MVDVWLIFAQVLPWVEVLLHTLIDWVRFEEENGRQVNHHGRAINVGQKEEADKEIVCLTILAIRLHSSHNAKC